MLLLLTYLENYDSTLCGFPHHATAAEGSQRDHFEQNLKCAIYTFVCL